ncbi:hypothetical protein V8E54_006414 [Elaphomyces granulatus]|jgi:hypothetical protein
MSEELPHAGVSYPDNEVQGRLRALTGMLSFSAIDLAVAALLLLWPMLTRDPWYDRSAVFWQILPLSNPKRAEGWKNVFKMSYGISFENLQRERHISQIASDTFEDGPGSLNLFNEIQEL